jgi:(p)ppGpp synthase/HD superfamily hydrolase
MGESTLNFQLIHAIASTAHRGQVDKGGEAYILHPRAVSEILAEQRHSSKLQAVALLHDVLEDTDEDVESLLAKGVPQEVLDVVQILTRRHDSPLPLKEPYTDYIARISLDHEATLVKLADLQHNMDPSRTMPPEARKRLMKRYLWARAMLQSALEWHVAAAASLQLEMEG